ncbi:hypothetical protein [Natronomonas sp. EA1]|uniref:hypothetical protein n=1 Tax=Natronomonas sp. EA1 TaxID=3421655 RepID=UPI003EB7AD7E
MTVLIAATGRRGDAAAAALDEVIRVETLAAARDHLEGVAVAVVGPLTDGDPATLREATTLRDSATAFVHLGPHEAFATCLPASFEPKELREAVAAAREAVAYREAVDEFYRRCAAAASTVSTEESIHELRAARERADERFTAARSGAFDYWELLADD